MPSRRSGTGGSTLGRADPRVTLVVLTYNRADDLARGLDRVLALPECPRVIVVDNASGDATRQVVARRFPAVELVSLEENLGAAGRNVGIERAATPYVALSDDDTWWAPGALTRAADLLDAHPRLAVVTGRVLVGAEQREDPTCALMAASPLPASHDLPGTPVLGFLAGACMVRRGAFLAMGGFERRLFLGGEERLAAVDLASAGWAMAYVADVVIHHHPSSRRDAPARRRLLLRNALWVAWLRRPAASALRETGRAVRAALGDSSLRRAIAEALAGVPWVLRHRRVIPAHLERALRRLEAAGPGGTLRPPHESTRPSPAARDL